MKKKTLCGNYLELIRPHKKLLITGMIEKNIEIKEAEVGALALTSILF